MEPTGVGDISIRPATVADSGDAAKLHAEQISEGFLPSLGTSFMTRLYRRIVLFHGSFLLMAETRTSRQTVGFIAGATDVGALYKKFLVRDGVVASIEAAPRLLKAWPRALETLRHGTDNSDSQHGAELLAVAVDPAWRGRGIGDDLVDAFVSHARSRGAERSYVVVGADNRTAISLYKRAGFETTDEFEMHPGTKSLTMCRSLATTLDRGRAEGGA